MVLVVPGKRNVLLSDVLVTSCVAVYTKYKQSDQGACWCVPLSGTFHFAMEQCLKRKLDSVLEVFSFLFFFFFTLALRIVFTDIIYSKWRTFKPNTNAAVGFQRNKELYHRGCLSHPAVLAGCSVWNFCIDFSWLGSIWLLRCDARTDMPASFEGQMEKNRLSGQAGSVYRYTSKWTLL